MVAPPTFGFGDLSREEINSVLSQAGVSLFPPKKVTYYNIIIIICCYGLSNAGPGKKKGGRKKELRILERLDIEFYTNIIIFL